MRGTAPGDRRSRTTITWPTGAAHLGSAGYPTTGVRGPHRRTTTARDVPDGEPGELWIRGANLMSGYWGDPEATDQVLRRRLVPQRRRRRRSTRSGLVSIVGRERDMLISGGLNVYPAEVEAVLHRHPGISEAAVFGMPDDLWGEVGRRGHRHAHGHDATSRRGRRATALDSLAGYKLPRRIIFVDALPKGNTGKVSKQELRAHDRDTATAAVAGD